MSRLLLNKEISLRYIPGVPQNGDLAGTFGGMYASAKLGFNMPLEAISKVPGYFEHPTLWKLKQTHDKNIHIIYIPHAEDADICNVSELGFHHASEAPRTPVTLGPVSDYRIEVKAELHGGKIVLIRPARAVPGVDCYVGVGTDNQLEIQGFSAGTMEGLPGWFFHE